MKFLTPLCLCVLLFTSVAFTQILDSTAKIKDNLPIKDSVRTSADTVNEVDHSVLYSILVKTEPDSAVIVVDDSIRGISPLNVTNLKSGDHIIIVKKKGFYQKKISLVVDSSSAKELSVLLQQPGSVSISSQPVGSEVWWNGEKKGATPLNITLLKPGTYSFQLKKDQFLTFEKSITILSGKSDSVFCKMSPDTALLNSIKREQKQQHSKKTKITSIILAAAFGLFAAIVTIVDFSGDQ